MAVDGLVLPTRAGLVAQRLRDMIESGELAPGAVLRQTEIAERFGVSTTPVREAFATLMREGVVRQDAHRSVIVFQPAADELAQIYEIRGALEPLATELAAKNITDEQVAELEAIVEEMATAQPARYVQLNTVLHDRIYDIADRPLLVEILDRLRKTSASYVKLTVEDEDPRYRKAVQDQHEEIVAALKARKGKVAARVVRRHLQTSADHIARLVAATAKPTAKP